LGFLDNAEPLTYQNRRPTKTVAELIGCVERTEVRLDSPDSDDEAPIEKFGVDDTIYSRRHHYTEYASLPPEEQKKHNKNMKKLLRTMADLMVERNADLEMPSIETSENEMISFLRGTWSRDPEKKMVTASDSSVWETDLSSMSAADVAKAAGILSRWKQRLNLLDQRTDLEYVRIKREEAKQAEAEARKCDIFKDAKQYKYGSILRSDLTTLTEVIDRNYFNTEKGAVYTKGRSTLVRRTERKVVKKGTE